MAIARASFPQALDLLKIGSPVYTPVHLLEHSDPNLTEREDGYAHRGFFNSEKAWMSPSERSAGWEVVNRIRSIPSI